MNRSLLVCSSNSFFINFSSKEYLSSDVTRILTTFPYKMPHTIMETKFLILSDLSF